MRRIGIVATLTCLVSIAGAGPVLAATPPANDTYDGRVVISALPFVDTVDTSSATTDSTDVDADADCGAPALDASIWYELTPSSDGPIGIDASIADYSTGLLVVSGSPGAFTFETCGPGAVDLEAVAGVTYAILIFDYQGDEQGNGGTVTLSLGDAPPPPTVELAVDARGSFDAKTGVATIRGTITCTGGAITKQFVDVSMVQTVGRFKLVGGSAAPQSFNCDGTAERWEADVEAFSGTFAGGNAVVSAYAFVCGPLECGSAEVLDQLVRLRR